MLVLTSHVQSPYFDPSNPNQQPIEKMVQQGGDRAYATFYWNQVPNAAGIQFLSPSGAIAGAEPMSFAKKLAIGLGIAAVVVGGGIAYGAVTRDYRHRSRRLAR